MNISVKSIIQETLPLKPTDLLLVTWNRPKLTEMTLRSIKQNTTKGTYKLIVIDNNSDEETKTVLKKYRDDGTIDMLFLNKENIGLEGARQQGLEMVWSDYFVCIDNDILAPKKEFRFAGYQHTDWLQKLTILMDRHPEYGAISARTQVMIGTGNIFDGHENEEIVEFPHPGGSLRIMRTEAVKDVGGWDRKAPGRGSEERYICGKLNEAGHKTGFAVKVKCLHLFGDKDTDRWGYSKDWKPEDTGHSDVYHPKLEQGDDSNEIKEYIDD